MTKKNSSEIFDMNWNGKIFFNWWASKNLVRPGHPRPSARYWGRPSPKSMRHIAFSPYFGKIYKFPLCSFNLHFLLNLGCFLSPYFDHLCIMHVLDAPELNRRQFVEST